MRSLWFLISNSNSSTLSCRWCFSSRRLETLFFKSIAISFIANAFSLCSLPASTTSSKIWRYLHFLVFFLSHLEQNKGIFKKQTFQLFSKYKLTFFLQFLTKTPPNKHLKLKFFPRNLKKQNFEVYPLNVPFHQNEFGGHVTLFRLFERCIEAKFWFSCILGLNKQANNFSQKCTVGHS